MNAPPISFIGVSKFSENFQVILERTFTVANLPVKNLETDRTLIGQRKIELGALAADLQALRDVVASLGALGAAGLTTVGTSNAAVAVASSAGAPEPISLDVVVSSSASRARETTTSGLPNTGAAPLSADGIYKLTVGSATSVIDLSGGQNTLAGLRNAINGGDYGVTATILNLSDDPQNPDFRLSIAANTTGAQALSLKSSADADLLTAQNQGSNAVFAVNGVPATNASNTIADFAPGLSLTIVGSGSASIVVGDDTAGVKSKLAELAQRYNAVAARIRSHVGEDAGALSGDILIREAQSALRSIAAYAGPPGGVGAIVELGLELDDQGRLSFDTARFDRLAVASFQSVRDFLGSTTAGFAGAAYARLGDLADPVTGRIRTAVGFLEESDRRLSQEIARLQERIDLQIATLEARFGAADNLLAHLEAQQSLLTRLFETNRDR